MEIGVVSGIWRYPVKSLAPEPLECAQLEHDGIPGDRVAQLLIESGHARTGKAYRGKEHEQLHTIAQIERALDAAAARGVHARVVTGERYFDDDAPISLVFDHWIAEVEAALQMTLDPLRWRPNLYLRAMNGFARAEATLIGEVLEIGDAVVRVRDTIKRCVVTTYDVQGGEPEPGVLKYVAQRRANVLGIYADVESTGTVRPGAVVRLRAR